MCHSGSILKRTPTLNGSPGLIVETLTSDSPTACCFFAGSSAARTSANVTSVETASTVENQAAVRIVERLLRVTHEDNASPAAHYSPPPGRVPLPKGVLPRNKDTLGSEKLRARGGDR